MENNATLFILFQLSIRKSTPPYVTCVYIYIHIHVVA